MALCAASAARRALAWLTDTKACNLGSRRWMRERHSSTRSTGDRRRAAMSAARAWMGWNAGAVMKGLLAQQGYSSGRREHHTRLAVGQGVDRCSFTSQQRIAVAQGVERTPTPACFSEAAEN